MAGDWIKMRMNLQTHPKIVRISSALRTDKFRVIGALHAVWSVFDEHSIDGILPGYSFDSMDKMIGMPGFAQAMSDIGWLADADGAGLVMPRFDEHNGNSAKRRATDTKRKKSARTGTKDPQSVRKVSAKTSADDADKKTTREEKRREEIYTVLAHLNAKAGRDYQPVEANTSLILARLEEGATVEQCKAVIDAKVLKWKGDAEMDQYLRPATLFNRTKFAQYVGEIGRPATPASKFAGVK